MPLPQFNIKPEEITEKLQNLLQNQLNTLENCLKTTPTPPFAHLIGLLEQLDDRLHQFWSPIGHLHAVTSTPALRAAYQACLPFLTDYSTTLGQHKGLYQAYSHIKENTEFSALTAAQKRLIELRLRDFHLGGVALPPEQQQRYAAIEQELALLNSKFGEHVLDATQHWHYLVDDKATLAGLPSHVIEHAEQLAKQHQQTGFRLTLEYPCYRAIQQYAENRQLREMFYHAYVTRASELRDTQYNNAPLMQKILTLRHELAQLLDYKNYAELSLATKMAHHPQEVLDFLNELARYAKPAAQKEFAELQQFAGQTLSPWDMAYYTEKLSQQRYHIDQEQLRPYFPLERVLNNLFTLVETLFGLHISASPNTSTWHPDVRVYQIHDREKKPRGIFYIDLYVREQKREGAWMDDYCSRLHLSDNTLQNPVAFLTCNFARPQTDQPALLTHDDVITLFHEFGHGLHHLLTTVDYLDINGIHGVPWDAVEFPSQFLENWAWQRDILKNIARHHQTDAPLPIEKLDALLASRHFHAGLQLARQLEFALFDFHLHLQAPTGENFVSETLRNARTLVAAYPVPDYYRMPNTFSHIFDGGYAAGYYSYLWAEVLAADAFEAFETQGILNTDLGQQFLNCILSQGGSQLPEKLFIDFRGRKPDNQALLRAWGVVEKS